MDRLINLVSVIDERWASFRYRTQVIQEAMLLDGTLCRITPSFMLEASHCVYSKHFNLCDYSDAIGAKALGKTIIFDVCDDHHDRTSVSDHYERMIKIADVVTCNSEAMRERIWHIHRKKAHVIPDPIVMPPHDRKPNLNKWLWYGHPQNIGALEENLHLIEGKDLEICTLTDRPIMREGNTKVTLWSPDEQQEAFKRNGVAFIPYKEAVHHSTKSANRVIEALNASLVPVVINPIPAVKDLLAFCETSPESVTEASVAKMEAGRAYVRRNYSTKEIGKLWKKVMT